MRGVTFKIVVEKGDNQTEDKPQESKGRTAHDKTTSRRYKKLGFLIMAAALVIALILFGWRLYRQQQIKNLDPFTTHTRSLVTFPLYYPTRLPNGYHIEKTSVTNPDTGVLVFTITDADEEHFIYISEEAKPKSFNFKGYYLAFSDRKHIATPFGTATTGVVSINGGGHAEIGSLTSNKTWLVTNTDSDIPFSQLDNILTSLALSH
jgi:hypothetical protein